MVQPQVEQSALQVSHTSSVSLVTHHMLQAFFVVPVDLVALAFMFCQCQCVCPFCSLHGCGCLPGAHVQDLNIAYSLWQAGPLDTHALEHSMCVVFAFRLMTLRVLCCVKMILASLQAADRLKPQCRASRCVQLQRHSYVKWGCLPLCLDLNWRTTWVLRHAIRLLFVTAH